MEIINKNAAFRLCIEHDELQGFIEEHIEKTLRDEPGDWELEEILAWELVGGDLQITGRLC